MTHDESVHVLTSILRADCDARPVLLLGAGASFSSGVPLAAECVRRIGRRVFAERVKGRAIVPEQVKLSEWFPWLQHHSWFVPGEDRLADNFPLIVEHLLVPREYRKQVFLELLQPSSGIGPGYKALSELGYADSCGLSSQPILIPVFLWHLMKSGLICVASPRLTVAQPTFWNLTSLVRRRLYGCTVRPNNTAIAT